MSPFTRSEKMSDCVVDLLELSHHLMKINTFFNLSTWQVTPHIYNLFSKGGIYDIDILIIKILCHQRKIIGNIAYIDNGARREVNAAKIISLLHKLILQGEINIPS